ncbi:MULTISPECIES: response regulator transcription factor [Flavobacteriales]|uniref:response regulator transcription factor n=1 Tax=Flavobacteriales TaxID=200644 RepID=UPI000810DEDB|nr:MULTISPECIES: response regulator transcription factor [Flavobacteriales]MBW3521747.1 response regulator transcription factor [Chryseobacterium sp. NKUCC03_KSP]MDM1461379.1 response regulator transcription factor [Myroides odoratimimus]OCK52295.1 histidine kinase [Chryseobacterium sp. CBo1]
METGTSQQKITFAFIDGKSPILDLIYNELIASGIEVLFKSENIEDGLKNLSNLKVLPKTCIIDLDFYDKNILEQLQKLSSEYPSIKLIAHSDIDDDKVYKVLLDIGFLSCLLVGSDVDDFKRAIDSIDNG